MGFRSTLISDHFSGSLPEWFKEKYNSYLSFPGGMMIASTCEVKLYGGQELFEDYQKALKETDSFPLTFPITVIVLAEDSNITKVTITRDKIVYTLMEENYEAEWVWAQGL